MDKKKGRRRKSRLKKPLIILVFIVIIGLIIFKNISKGKKVEEIKSNKLRIGNVVEKLTETGNIELVRTLDVKSKIAGTIEKIMIKEGDKVRVVPVGEGEEKKD